MYVRIWAPSAWTVTCLLAAFSNMDRAAGQSSAKTEPLPKITVEQSEKPAPAKPTKKKTASKAKQPGTAPPAPPTAANAVPNGVPADRRGSLVSPNTAEARAERMASLINRTAALDVAVRKGNANAMTTNSNLMNEFLEVLRADLRATQAELGEDRRERREDRRERRTDRRK